MERFTNAGRKAIADKNLYAALSLALMLPDICGSLEEPGLNNGQSRYKAWFTKWAQPKFTGNNGHIFLSAADCYQLRCSLIHSGSSEITPKKRVVIEQIEFFDDSGPLHLGWFEGNTINGVIQPNVLALRASDFSETMYRCAEEWDQATASDPVISEEKRKLLTIRSGGHVLQGVQIG